MQVFANIATDPVRKISKTNSAKAFYETRICENHRGGNGNASGSGNKAQATFYTVRIMHDVNPGLVKGDFVKVTGHLKVDSYYSTRDGKPASALLIIAFEATKIKGVDDLKKVREANLAVAKEAVAA
jgi:single-stranded DNA-binding protein